MRPGQISPGNPERTPALRRVEPASMRPGQISPGNNQGRLPRWAFDEASMRPGQISPGNSGTGADPPARSPSFNEARADQPGKCPTRTSMLTGAARLQ